MGKKQVAVSLRKPPPPADPNAFVAAGAESTAPLPKTQVATEAPVVATRVGERREMTIYLPQDLARKLSIRCVELDRDLSNLVAEAVEKSLTVEQPEPVVEVTVPADRWQRVRAFVTEWSAHLPHTLRARIGARIGIV